jgi:hypothetical protein
MATPGLKHPTFANEAEEAQWWFEHPDLLLENFERAEAEGTLGRGRAMQRALAADNAIQLGEEDAAKARAAAARKGVEYHDYLKTLIHEALEKEPAA